jgi:hypothetical protein
MKLIDKLISQIRKQTENENEAAIDNSEILQYLNDGQERLHAVVSAKHPKAFIETKEYDIVPGQADYELPVNVFLDNKVLNVEYSYSGQTDDYYPLDPITLKERTNYSGYPTNYIRRSGKVTLDPIPDTTSGKIRVEYVKRINHLDLRRGVVDVITTDSSTITSLVLDTSNLIAIDGDAFNDVEYVCLVDKYGNIGYANIPVDSVDTSTGVVTITSGYEFSAGESASAGDYIVVGENTSTHSEFPRNCERYLIAYASWKLLKRDSSVDFAEQQQELLAMEDDIVASYADVDDDYQRIPVYSSFDYWE